MKISEIVREIRARTGVSQRQLADALNVTFATVNRWENGHCEPTPLAVDGLRNFCEQRGFDYAEFEGNIRKTGSGAVTLYHGSKSGLRGDIRPISRELCDFGQGFYMGTEKSQPLTLICNFPQARLYEVEFDLTGLQLIDIEVGIDWALLIAFHRGKMEDIKGTVLYEKYRTMSACCDVVIGYIANDRMFVVLDRFFSGEITDIAFINSLAALKLGKQYVALTEKACSQIRILSETTIGPDERKELQAVSDAGRREGIAKAEEICRKYRREGRFFDEIIAGGK